MNEIDSSNTYRLIKATYSISELKDSFTDKVPINFIDNGNSYQFVSITYSVKEFGDCSTSKILWVLKKVAKDRNLPLSAVAQPLRVALTGGTKSPPIDDVWDILGEEKSLKRIDDALKQHGIEE